MISWLWNIFKGNRLQALLNVTTGLAGVTTSLVSVWAMQRAIDIAAGYRTGSLYWAVGLMAFVILCDFAVRISRVWIRNILGIKAQNTMQQHFLDRLLHSEWHGKEKFHSGDVINRLEQDVKTVVDFITEVLPNALSTAAMFICAFFYLWSMDAVLAVITVAILPVFILLSRIYVNRMRMYTRKVRGCDSTVQSIMQETVRHRMLVKTLECSSSMTARLDAAQSELRGHVRGRTKFSVFSNLMLNTGFSLGYLVAFLWGAIRLYEHTITFGMMTAFLQLVYRIQSPARDITRIAPAFVAAITAAERLRELEQIPPEPCEKPHLMSGTLGVRMQDVTYSYPDGDEVINSLSFDFKPGTCTAILGETGAGKTTIFRLILALLHPSSGSLHIYNNVESKAAHPSLRCNMVYVPQGNTLLSGSIRDNLLLANADATDSEMRDALHQACADFVLTLPDALDTKVAEDGAGLSEGQAQRIAIARAILRNRSIMLFDEATSALDPDTERQLLHNIIADSKKTVIFITHRPAVVDYCQQVLKINF